MIRPCREAASPRVVPPPRPWHGQRHQTAWTCQRAHDAALEQFPRFRLLRRPRSATPPKSLIDPTVAVQRARPPALGLRCHRAHRMPYGTKLLGHANGRMTQPRTRPSPASPLPTTCMSKEFRLWLLSQALLSNRLLATVSCGPRALQQGRGSAASVEYIFDYLSFCLIHTDEFQKGFFPGR